MTAPLDQAMKDEIKNCVRKEFTVYYKNDGILYRKTTTRDFMSNNDKFNGIYFWRIWGFSWIIS